MLGNQKQTGRALLTSMNDDECRPFSSICMLHNNLNHIREHTHKFSFCHPRDKLLVSSTHRTAACELANFTGSGSFDSLISPRPPTRCLFRRAALQLCFPRQLLPTTQPHHTHSHSHASDNCAQNARQSIVGRRRREALDRRFEIRRSPGS